MQQKLHSDAAKVQHARCPILVGRARFGESDRLEGPLKQPRSAADRVDVGWVDADTALLAVDRLEADDAVDLGVDRVILADPGVIADPELCAALADDDGPGAHELAVGAL